MAEIRPIWVAGMFRFSHRVEELARRGVSFKKISDQTGIPCGTVLKWRDSLPGEFKKVTTMSVPIFSQNAQLIPAEPVSTVTNIEVLRQYTVWLQSQVKELSAELKKLRNASDSTQQEWLDIKLRDHLSRLQKQVYGAGREGVVPRESRPSDILKKNLNFTESILKMRKSLLETILSQQGRFSTPINNGSFRLGLNFYLEEEYLQRSAIV